jgi:MFS family permease
MLFAPFSEINGRRPVFIATGTLYVLCSLFCAITDSFAGMLAARFFLGVGGSTFSTMVGGILADIWVSAERNTPMVLFTGATLFGTGLGPLVSGIVAQELLWRWVFYIQVFTSGSLVALVTIFFKETRGSIILSHKAKALNKWYEAIEAAGAIGVSIPPSSPSPIAVDDPEKPQPVQHQNTTKRVRYRVLADEQRASLLKLISLSLYRPFHLLFTEPVVFWFSVWISFAWSVLYLQFGSVPLVFSTVYNFTLAQTGYVFTSMCIGAIISTVLSIYQDAWAVKHFPQYFTKPEGRLLFTCIESALVPIGLFIFGWTCYPSVHWIAPTIAVGIATMGIFSVFLAVFNYSADVYHSYASSALAASGLCRNLLGGSFPLVAHALFNNLGFHAASSLLGGIAAGLTLVPWVLVKWGPAIRKRSRIASAFLEEQQGMQT